MSNRKGHRLLRFLKKKPSIFQFPDDPEGKERGVEALALELEPREVDEGKLSFWEVEDDRWERFVVAAFAARRERKDKVDILRLPYDLLDGLNVQPESKPDDETCECIKDRHRELDLSAESTRLQLAHAIWDYLSEQKPGQTESYDRIRRGDIEATLRKAHRECLELSGNVEEKLIAPWALEFIRA